MTVAVLVPYRAGVAERDAAWRHLEQRWSRYHPDWRVISASDESAGSFNRGRALNRAAAQAGDADTLVVCQADAWPDPDPLRRIVAGAPAYVVACEDEHHLSPAASHRFMRGEPVTHIDCEWHWKPYHPFVISREAWQAVGGCDERFVGWGDEDVAFNSACQAILGDCPRRGGDAWHLWHPSQTLIVGEVDASKRLRARYEAASLDADRMRRLIAER